jgi:hypothetical protein
MKPIRTLLFAAVVALALAGMAMADVQEGSDIDEAKLLIFETPRYLGLVDTVGARSISRQIGSGYQVVDVQVRGWELEYTSEDRHVSWMFVRIDDVSYNSQTGNVSFTVSALLEDFDGSTGGTAEFFWKVRYAIFAVR